jgi:hypothetical protein
LCEKDDAIGSNAPTKHQNKVPDETTPLLLLLLLKVLTGELLIEAELLLVLAPLVLGAWFTSVLMLGEVFII